MLLDTYEVFYVFKAHYFFPPQDIIPFPASILFKYGFKREIVYLISVISNTQWTRMDKQKKGKTNIKELKVIYFIECSAQ